MADYPGAVAAIKARFEANWASTPYCYVNGQACATVDDPTSESPNPINWALFEIAHVPSYIAATGTPGQQTIVYPGMIKVHIMSPHGLGDDAGLALAVAAGEIFRNKLFYDDVTPGCFVRTGYDLNGQPRVDGGDIVSDDGEWFSHTATIPFEYWHRG